MSEPQGDVATGGDSVETAATPPATPAYRGVALTLAAALLLIAVLAGTAPFWAPSLPWAPPAREPRIDRIEQTLQQIRQDEAAAATTGQQLERRVAALAAKPAPAAGDIADLDRRVAATDRALQAQAATGAGLTARVDALETTAHREVAAGSSDTAILLALLRIREALASGQPFAAEYDALAGLAKNRPEVAAAAAPLAEPAQKGVATRAALLTQLRRVVPAIAAAQASPVAANKAAGWGAAVLARLRGLVRVRRLDGGTSESGGNGSSTPVAAAEQALAAGDLAGAVAALETLSGGAAEAAQSWLAVAKRRLAAENAMRRLEAVLAAQLAQPGDAAKASGK